MSDKHPPQQTVSSSDAGAPEATILRGASKATTPPLRGTSKATTPPLRGTSPSQEGSRKNSPPEKGEYPEGGRGLVPKLRFPEFREAGEWKIKLLGDVCQTYSGGTPTSTNKNYYGGHISFIRSAEIEKSSTALHLTQEGLQSSSAKMVDKGDILYALYGANSGEVAIAKIAGAINQAVLCLKSKGSNAFIFQFLSFNKNQIINKYIQGGQGNLSGEIVKSIEVPFPELKEQQKIADCLSSLDTLITAQTEKIDALKTHKKGLMQQLFPQDGETVPRLRFSSKRAWEVFELPKVAFFQEGPGIMAVDFHDEGIPLVRLSGIGGTAVTLDGCNYLDPEKVSNKWAHFRLEIDDLIISTSATFGLTSIVTEVAAGAVFYTGLIRFKPISEKLLLGYLRVYLGSPHFERQAVSAAVGGGIKHFGPTHLKQMEIPLPPPEEQQKIADCLSSLDTLITAETEKLDALKTHKKGLMQQLFPVVENEIGA